MHQPGHSRAHSMQTVQFSSTSAMTPRAARRQLRLDIGVLLGTARRVRWSNVTSAPGGVAGAASCPRHLPVGPSSS